MKGGPRASIHIQDVTPKGSILVLNDLLDMLLSVSDLVTFCVSPSLVAFGFSLGEQLFRGGLSTHLRHRERVQSVGGGNCPPAASLEEEGGRNRTSQSRQGRQEEEEHRNAGAALGGKGPKYSPSPATGAGLPPIAGRVEFDIDSRIGF